MHDQNLKKVRCQVEILQRLLLVILNNVRHFGDELQLDMIHLVFLGLDRWATVEEEVCKKNEAVVAQDWQQNKNAVVKAACESISFTHKLQLRMYEKHNLPKHLKVNTGLFSQLFSESNFLLF